MTGRIARRDFLRLAAVAAMSGAPKYGLARAAEPWPLAKGFNLPDQAPLSPGREADVATLKWLRARGFAHVRLPIRAEASMAAFSDRAQIDGTLADLDRALDKLLGVGFVVSVDMHPGAEFGRLMRTDHVAASEALEEGWSRLATMIRRYPANRINAELLNEPPVQDAVWREMARRLARAVRAELPDTTLVVGAAPYQRVEALAAWTPIADQNIVYAAHYYDPMPFTHQGMTWDAASPMSRLEGVPFPSSRDDPKMGQLLQGLRDRGDDTAAQTLQDALVRPWTRETVNAQFDELAAWSRANKTKVIVNEFGVLRFKAPRASRLEWIRTVREATEASGFGWAHWDYSDGFGLLDENARPDVALIDALLGS
jgi:endoglucanase